MAVFTAKLGAVDRWKSAVPPAYLGDSLRQGGYRWRVPPCAPRVPALSCRRRCNFFERRRRPTATASPARTCVFFSSRDAALCVSELGKPSAPACHVLQCHTGSTVTGCAITVTVCAVTVTLSHCRVKPLRNNKDAVFAMWSQPSVYPSSRWYLRSTSQRGLLYTSWPWGRLRPVGRGHLC